MKKLILPLAIAFCLDFSAQCLAQSLDAQNADTTGFRSIVTSAQQYCENLQCPQSPVQARKLSVKETNQLGASLLSKFRATCQEIAEIEWPETILEGPYVASFQIQIKEIQILTFDQGVLGYWVTYQDQAWNTDHCNYDPRQPSSLDSCEPGVFEESAFISAKNGSAFRDPNDYVEFKRSVRP